MPDDISESLLSDLQWNALLRGIEQDSCIICLGPEFYSDPPRRKSQSQRLATFLRGHAAELGIRVQENGWYHLGRDGEDGATYEAVRSFYEQEAEGHQSTLNLLAEIKTHLLLNMTPDQHLASTFDDLGYRYRPCTYVRNQPNRDTEVPTQQVPMIYNMVGHLDQRNSLVLTYDDFFDYIQSTSRGVSMSSLLKDNILSADYFIFLGLPEDDWRMHLFLRILQQHENGKNKYATMPGAGELAQLSWNEQYDIKLINDRIDSFVAELHRRCKEKGLLRAAVRQETQSDNFVGQMLEKAARNEIESVITDLLDRLRGVGQAGMPMMRACVGLKGRLRDLEEQKMLRIISHENATLDMNKIRDDLLQLIDSYREMVDQLGISQ
ncbi:hypothetical protein CEQ90_14950 [Lewinellaceae bacterium SD302]|nr:hypothetical protein CEQ90_14950 [Lewinellaceae bacterium SD302]